MPQCSIAGDTNALATVCVMLYEQVSWAPGIGIKKSPFKKLFDEEHGVTYIPWSKLPSSLESLAEGGLLDEDSLPPPPPCTGDCCYLLELCNNKP